MSSGAPPRDAQARSLAERSYELVQARPGEARRLAERALAAARDESDHAATVTALHALAWAQHVLGDVNAIPTARRGIRLAERHGEAHLAALLRRRLALMLAFAGATRAARRELAAATAGLSGIERARTEVFRLAIEYGAPTVDPAEQRQVASAAAGALRRLRAAGDEIWTARLLYNRGLLLARRGALDAAEADVRIAEEIYRRCGAAMAALDAAGTLAELALLRGDVVGYLEGMDAVEDAAPEDYLRLPAAEYRAAGLAQARLLSEAAAAAESYVDFCSHAGWGDYAAHGLLDRAAVALLMGDAQTARHVAGQATRSFAARGKTVNAALARALSLRAQLLAGDLRPTSLRTARAIAATLERAGWRREALRTRLLAARVALALGAQTAAEREHGRARALGRSGTALDRIELAHVTALLHAAAGDAPRARRALGGGLALLEAHRSTLGSLELRAAASGIGVELVEEGLRLALETGRPVEVMRWVEALRANALRLPPVRPARDRDMRERRTELRRIASQLRAAEARDPERRLVLRQAQLEQALRERARHARGRGRTVDGQPALGEAARVLGDRALVEYVELDGILRALTLVDGQLNLHELGTVDVEAELDWLRFALRRLARGPAAAEQRSALLASAQQAAATLDRLLVVPLAPTVGVRRLVVVPTGLLHALPWGALPSLRGRPVVVAPSLALWVAIGRRRQRARSKTAVVAGPHLRHTGAEVRQVAALHPAATVLRGGAATADATLAALDGAGLAHIACHGRFRADSPLFSSLELADGPITALDLQRLRRAPDVVVLSACDAALSDRYAGDELLGLAAVLLGLGTRTIVASVVPVPDAAARRLMVALHRNLVAGDGPATALAHAQATLRGKLGALAGFVCLGSG